MRVYDPACDIPLVLYNPPPGGFTEEGLIARLDPKEAANWRVLLREVPSLVHLMTLFANAIEGHDIHVVVHTTPPAPKRTKKATKKATKYRRPHSTREASRARVAEAKEAHPEWGRTAIAEACGLSPSYVGALLRDLRGQATLAAIAQAMQ